MLLGAAAAPAIPLIGIGIGTLLAIVGWIVVVGLVIAHRYTLGWVLRQLGNLLIDVGFRAGVRTIHPLRAVGNRLLWVDRTILRLLGVAERGTRHAVIALFGALTTLSVAVGQQVAGLAEDAHNAIWNLRNRALPGAVGAATAPFRVILRRHTAALERIQGVLLPRLGRRVGFLERTWRERLAVFQRGIDRLDRIVTRTIPASIAAVGARVTALDLARARHHLRLRTLERALVPAAFAALTLAALGRLGLGWLRCSRVSRVGSRLCGLPDDLVNLLLSGTVFAFILSDLCNVVSLMQRGAEEFEPVLIGFVNEIEGHVCGGREAAPSGTVSSDWRRVARLPSGL